MSAITCSQHTLRMSIRTPDTTHPQPLTHICKNVQNLQAPKNYIKSHRLHQQFPSDFYISLFPSPSSSNCFFLGQKPSRQSQGNVKSDVEHCESSSRAKSNSEPPFGSSNALFQKCKRPNHGHIRRSLKNSVNCAKFRKFHHFHHICIVVSPEASFSSLIHSFFQ